MEDLAPDVTAPLNEIAGGNDRALARLMPLVYDELRRLAARHLSLERSDHTLQTTALVHEAYILLVKQLKRDWPNRTIFFQVAAKMMRRVLVDHARQHLRAKRGGGALKVSLDDVSLFAQDRTAEVLAIDESLNRLAVMDARQAQVVELRFYGGMSVEETADILHISEKTVKRDWSFARAWLYGDLKARYGAYPNTVGTTQDPV
jgi:RNA polymerase sigma-70 factor (ECF subfamily)